MDFFILRRFLVLAASLACASCASASSILADNSAMPASDPQSTVVRLPEVRLEAQFRFEQDARRLQVHYAVRNMGTVQLMTLDRGIVQGNRVELDPQPVWRMEDDGITFSRGALGLPHPSPAVPRSALAGRLDPGASHTAEFVVSILAPDVHRVRFCLGVSPWGADAFTAMDGHAELWRASFRLADSQTLLCTPWFDLGTQRFEDVR